MLSKREASDMLPWTFKANHNAKSQSIRSKAPVHESRGKRHASDHQRDAQTIRNKDFGEASAELPDVPRSNFPASSSDSFDHPFDFFDQVTESFQLLSVVLARIDWFFHLPGPHPSSSGVGSGSSGSSG